MSVLLKLRQILVTGHYCQWTQTAGLATSHRLYFDRDLRSTNFVSLNKKYFIDAKEGAKGRYMKISELSKGKRFTVQIAGADFEEVFAKLGSTEEDFTVQGAGKLYTIKRIHNNYGKYTDLIEKSDEGTVFRIVIPDEALVQMLQSLEELKPMLYPQDAGED